MSVALMDEDRKTTIISIVDSGSYFEKQQEESKEKEDEGKLEVGLI